MGIFVSKVVKGQALNNKVKFSHKSFYQSLVILWSLTITLSFTLYQQATTQATTWADEPQNDFSQAVKAILSRRCFQCHGKNGVANKNIFVLNYSRLIADKVIIPGNADSLLLKQVENGNMPLGGPRLSGDEQAILHNWIVSGAADWNISANIDQNTGQNVNKDLSIKTSSVASQNASTSQKFMPESTILALIEKDLEQAQYRTRPFLRYFSIAHLNNAHVPTEELAEYRIGLAKLINSLSWHREISIPQPIDEAKTIFRIDLRDFNWTAGTWRMVLAVYPYGVKVAANESIKNLSGAELPYIRADWFVANASLPPLYNDLLYLPNTIQELEKSLGVDVYRNLTEERNVTRAGIRNSGVSQNNRVVERHSSLYGAYWRSYDFRNNQDDQNIFRDPIALKPAGGEMIFNLPNGMQAYYLANGQGKRLDAAPIEIVSDRTSPDDPVVRNGRSCMSCHFAGMKYFKDDMRGVLEANSSPANRNLQQIVSLEKALAIYGTQDQLDKLVEQDQDRFKRAIEQSGSKLSGNVESEPINALSRRFNAELSIDQAAAESGLELAEFQARLRSSSRLTNLGYNQLLVPNGGFKRDSWERYFGELVGELHLGDYVPHANLVATNTSTINNVSSNLGANPINSTPSLNRSSNSTPTSAINNPALNANQVLTLAQVPLNSVSSPGYTGTNQRINSPNDLLRSAQTIFITSKTSFLKEEVMERELLNSPEFQAQNLILVKDYAKADLLLTFDKPVFTYNFNFTITHIATSVVLANGKATAINGNAAAPKLRKLIVDRLQSARQKTW